MKEYALRRLLLAVPTILLVIVVVFMAVRVIPGDPIDFMIPTDMEGDAKEEYADRIRAQYGFDQPLHIQLIDYMGRVIRLDLGSSLRRRTPVVEELVWRVPNTLQLGVFALTVSILLGIPIGIVSAMHRSSLGDNVAMFGALFGVSMPSFFFGYMLMLLFGLNLKILPLSGFGGALYTWEGFRHAVMPGTTLALGSLAVLARFTRSSMLEIIAEDYIRTARSKGVSERVVIFKHALKNALIPVVTLLGIQFGAVLAGSVVVEAVFAWPGVGRYMVGGITSRDFPVVQASVLVIAFGFIFANLLTDLTYAFIDPRIAYD
ncbi:MAG: ABC transporter permease [Bacillota bacterium]